MMVLVVPERDAEPATDSGTASRLRWPIPAREQSTFSTLVSFTCTDDNKNDLTGWRFLLVLLGF